MRFVEIDVCKRPVGGQSFLLICIFGILHISGDKSPGTAEDAHCFKLEVLGSSTVNKLR